MSFEERLSDWVDVDTAIVVLAEELGIVPRSLDWKLLRPLIETNNEVTCAMHDGLEAFVTAGLLERRDLDDIQYRWHGSDSLGDWRRRRESIAPDEG